MPESEPHSTPIHSQRLAVIYTMALILHKRYDTWGLRRNPDDWSYDDVPTSHIFDRGFTGHQHLERFELINMPVRPKRNAGGLVRPKRSGGGNGRVYDPKLGRFLSPDPVIQAPGNPQNYNRYSYVLNNPLKYTDPSGYVRIEEIYNNLMDTPYGGTWSPEDGYHVFTTEDGAFEAGMDYVNTTDSWGEGHTAPSEQAVRNAYEGGYSPGETGHWETSVKGFVGQNSWNGTQVGNTLSGPHIVAKDVNSEINVEDEDKESNPYKFAENVYYSGMALGMTLYLSDGPQIGPGDVAGATYQAATIITTGLAFSGIYLYQVLNPNIEGTTTSRGNPTNWGSDPEIQGLENNKYYPPGGKPPWWWPVVGATGSYELYNNWPSPSDMPRNSQDFIGPKEFRELYPYSGN